MLMSYYERPSPEEYEDIIDDLEAVNEEHVEHIKNLKDIIERDTSRDRDSARRGKGKSSPLLANSSNLPMVYKQKLGQTT